MKNKPKFIIRMCNQRGHFQLVSSDKLEAPDDYSWLNDLSQCFLAVHLSDAS